MPLSSSAPDGQLSLAEGWPCQSGGHVPRHCTDTPEGRAVFRPLIQQLIEARRKRGLRQEDLDLMIGCADRLVSKWESHTRNPSAYFLLLWCQALGVRLVIQEDH